MKRRSVILSVMLWALALGAGLILLCAQSSSAANDQLSPPFPWDTAEGKACIDQWMSYAAARLNAFNGNANYNGNKPYRFNRYGVLEGRSFRSVAAPDDLRNYSNNVHAMVWAWYNPGRSGWGPMYELSSVEPVQGHVLRCLGGRTGTGGGTGGVAGGATGGAAGGGSSGGTGGGVKPCPNGSLACGFCLGSGIYNKWIQFGGERGILNCPIMDEADAARSPQGTSGRYAQFRGGDGGYIFWHGTGRLAYQSVVVRGCMFKLYRDAGNAASWLGFPLGDEYAVQGGQRQDFEGGYILWSAQTRACQAYRGGSGDKTQFCQAYAQTAVSQNKENLRRNCGYTGGRWHSNDDTHFSWCMGVDRGAADSETRIRDEELKRCGGTQPPPPPPPPTPQGAEEAGSDTNPNDGSTTVGGRHTYFCKPNFEFRTIWGTDRYTGDSAVCTAAVHAGLIKREKGGTVTIVIQSPEPPYMGSLRNEVRSESYDRTVRLSYVFSGSPLPRTPAGGALNLARIVAIRTYSSAPWAADAVQPGQNTYNSSQRSFPLGWDFRWPGSSGQNINRATAEVTLTQVPMSVEVGGSADFAVTMTGEWNTTGYGVSRDHTIRVEGASGTKEWSIGGDPNGTYKGQLSASNAFKVTEAQENRVIITIVATIRFGEHFGRIEIQLVYEH